MTTFAGWLNEQRKREDAVGWFARYWRDLPETPRLSSPSSIASHLEDRTTKPGQDKAGNYLPYGFRDEQGGQHVRDAYDATLHEYRAVRAQIVTSAAQADGVPAPEQATAGAQQAAEPQPASLAGQAVARATDAAVRAAQQHAVVTAGGAAQPLPLPQITLNTAGTSEALLTAIYRKLSRIERFLGLEADEDGGMVPADLPWADWYEQAAVYATAHGPGWDADARLPARIRDGIAAPSQELHEC